MKTAVAGESGLEALAQVRRAFEQWRGGDVGRGRTPIALKRQCVALLEHHRPFHVCQALGINAAALKQWSVALSGVGSISSEVSPPAFVALPDSPEPAPRLAVSGAALVVQLPDGTRIHGDDALALARLLSALRESAR